MLVKMKYQLLLIYVAFCFQLAILEEMGNVYDFGTNYHTSMVEALDKQIKHIQKKGSNFIPVTSFEKIELNGGNLPDNVARKFVKRGVIIVRNSVSSNLAQAWLADILKYLYNNNAFSKLNETSENGSIFWSKPQVKARQNARIMKIQAALLNAWHTSEDNEVEVDFTKIINFADRFKTQNPNDTVIKYSPQIANGGNERWHDPNFRKVYRHILEGNWEDYDPFEIDYRIEAISNKVDGFSFFKAFEGWLSLSSSSTNDGAMHVFPNLKEATAYWYTNHQSNKEKTPNSEKILIDEKWHPMIFNNLVGIPTLNPGDSVWWHPDMVYDFGPFHNGNDIISGISLAFGPKCQLNQDYARRLLHSFILGKSPPGLIHSDESGYVDKATVDDLTEIGRLAFDLPSIQDSADFP